MWPTTYDRAGTVTWQTRPNGSGGANLVYQDGGVTKGETDSSPFISVPDDRGRWMHVVAHIKSASGLNANDGIIQFFRRWEGTGTYTKIHEKMTSNTWDSTGSEQGISQGYILGWANDPYDQDTEWLIDDFTLSTTSLIDSTTTEIQETTEAKTINVYPNPASDHVTISGLSPKGKTTVVLNNTLGQQVGEVMNFTGKTSVQMNTADLSEGIYLLTVITNNQRFTTKIIR